MNQVLASSTVTLYGCKSEKTRKAALAYATANAAEHAYKLSTLIHRIEDDLPGEQVVSVRVARRTPEGRYMVNARFKSGNAMGILTDRT